MDKKELAALIRKIEAMKASMAIMQRELEVMVIQLKFIPVSQSSSNSDDEEVNDEFIATMGRQ